VQSSSNFSWLDKYITRFCWYISKSYDILTYTYIIHACSCNIIVNWSSGHVLVSLHWLRIPERIQFKLVVQVHRALQAMSQTVGPFTRLSDVLSPVHCVLHHVSIYSSCQFVARLSVQKGVSGVWTSSLKQFAGWHYVYRQSLAAFIIIPHLSLSSSSQTLFVLALVSRRCSITLFLFLSWPRSFTYCTWSR